MRNRLLSPVVQRDAGFLLANAGWIPNDLDKWIYIPAGEFLYSSENKTMVIENPFAIQKYPVTNLQFEKFIQDNGYDHKEFWSAVGWAWRIGEWNTKTDMDYLMSILLARQAEKRNKPFYWNDKKWNNPLAPVVGVTWFEAEAYSKWIAKQIGCAVRLPTEFEWERAARGVNGRMYPWGDIFDRNKVNCAALWKKDDDARYAFDVEDAGTTIVGQFREGDTLDGISDLSGNIFEWTSSWYGNLQVDRILRGGSWFNDRRYVCGSELNWAAPDYYLFDVGFRLVSPGI